MNSISVEERTAPGADLYHSLIVQYHMPINFNFIFHSTNKWQHSFDILKSVFLSDTHQSMKTLDSDLTVNQNIYADAVNMIGCV